MIFDLFGKPFSVTVDGVDLSNQIRSIAVFTCTPSELTINVDAPIPGSWTANREHELVIKCNGHQLTRKCNCRLQVWDALRLIQIRFEFQEPIPNVRILDWKPLCESECSSKT